MPLEELRRLVTKVQPRRREPDAVEVKAANHPRGTPDVNDSLATGGPSPTARPRLFWAWTRIGRTFCSGNLLVQDG